MALVGIRAFDIMQDLDVWRVIDHDTGVPLNVLRTRSDAESWVPSMAFRCGARQEPAGCQTWTTNTTSCGAYRCREHAATHEALCAGRRTQ